MRHGLLRGFKSFFEHIHQDTNSWVHLPIDGALFLLSLRLGRDIHFAKSAFPTTLRSRFLYGRPGGDNELLRRTGNIQRWARIAVRELRVHADAQGARNTHLNGWPRPLDEQCDDRTSLAFSEYECVFLRKIEIGVSFATPWPGGLRYSNRCPHTTFDGRKPMEI